MTLKLSINHFNSICAYFIELKVKFFNRESSLIKTESSRKTKLNPAELIEYDYSEYKKVTAWMNLIKSTDEWKQVDEEYAKVAAEWRKKCAPE